MWLKYSDKELTLAKVEALPQEKRLSDLTKPKGFWITDDTEDCWYSWCSGENWGLARLTHKHEIELDESNILILRHEYDLDDFSREWGKARWWGPEGEPRKYRDWCIEWARVAKKYDGLIITPYIWQRRMEMNWYYGWDCASGCIWNPKAIKAIKLLSVNPEIATKAA